MNTALAPPLLPALGALLLLAPHRGPSWPRHTAALTTALTFCLSLTLSTRLESPFISLLALGTVLAAPRRTLSRGALATLLLTQSAALGFFQANTFVVALLLFIAMTALPDLHLSHESGGSRPRDVVRVYLLIGTAPLCVATLLLGWLGWSPALGALLLVGLCTRLAAVPLHGWLPSWMTRSPWGAGPLWMSLAASLHLLNHWLLPRLPPEWTTDTVVPVLATLGAVTALYGALLAFIQKDLRRMLAFAVLSQTGLMLTGAASTNPEGPHGAWLHCLAAGLAFTGLDLLVRAVEARTGTTDLEQLGGLAERAPRMATLFLLLCLAAMGLPGTLGFVSEDLLLRATLGAHPWHLLLLPPALALNAFTLLRACHRAFLGPARLTPLQDLLPRERWVTTAWVLTVIAGGLAPPALHRSLAPPETDLPSTSHSRALDLTPVSYAREGPSGIPPRRAYREPESTRIRRKRHVPGARTEGVGRCAHGDVAARAGRL
ncbi:NADH dehydrogenase I subunit M [Myxococcus stipitatus DSM 14675]|uniref:NADH dehydrogenase I subunit M n=1 Tax=Myxococcus stipitatus (strain DSM 14675 / JCM 12634 / Mx s8) TaxID=1278073 RepID=L7U2J2_MYXSD|nr:proton-conducting transporter membrane subunit [Myxococcus stipitatus]AGC42035.1 NADH dehydrogenase I subunit M [Myxococcus stipitatus DSM 14675]